MDHEAECFKNTFCPAFSVRLLLSSTVQVESDCILTAVKAVLKVIVQNCWVFAFIVTSLWLYQLYYKENDC